MTTPKSSAQLWLGLIDADFEAGGDLELADQLRQLAARYTRAAG